MQVQAASLVEVDESSLVGREEDNMLPQFRPLRHD